ncbi:ASST-domain-containing protein [Mycena galericulata]|nr:ASST-domain-containing protein [Mycena galericulata]
MAPAAWNPPPDAEEYLEWTHDRKSVRCKVCQAGKKSNVGSWISRKSLKAHLECQTHEACLENRDSRAKAESVRHEQLLRAYEAPPTIYSPSLEPPGTSATPAMFAADPLDSIDEMDVDVQPSITHMISEFGQTQPEPELSLAERQALLQQEFERILTSALQEAHLGGNSEVPLIIEDPLDANDDEDDECVDLDIVEESGYFPYPNKTVMLLDILDNLPRCRFTSAQMSLVLHFAKSLGATNVPSLKGLRKTQKKLQTDCGYQPVKVVSPLGNIFYMNDIRQVIARDLSNPLVAAHLQLYVEENSCVSEMYQAERFMEYTPDQLTPMFSKGHKHFWIEELAQLSNQTFIIPHTWIVRNGVLTTDASIVTRTPDGRWNLTDIESIFNADDLELDYNDILAQFGPTLAWTEGSVVALMPNKMRELVDDDEDLVVVMVTPWADDVSGNKSKQYNKHMNMYAQNSSLPGRLLQQEFHVHYVSASPHASSAEQFTAFRDQVKSTETEPVHCFNAHTKRKCRIILRTPGLPADNPQQSEEACHMGSNANYPCRKCHWGGTKKDKETDQVYHACHEPGIARDVTEIRTELQEQLRLATLGQDSAIEARQRASGTKDKLTEYWIQKALALVAEIKDKEPRCSNSEIAARVQKWLEEQEGDKMNPLLDITGLDPSRDTPVELLHTVLLGVIKYIWHFMNTKQWSDKDRYLLAIRLQSTDISGLTVPPIRASYMFQYKNNLIGKHFKTLMQTLAFHVHDVCTPEEFTLIKAAGDLGARLWIPAIDDMDAYLEDLKVAIANLLDAWDAVDPLRIIVKIKLHLLAHLPDDIRRFGPAVRFTTEIQEKYNTVFRLCSINSNHLAPSRDIAQKFAGMDRVKHLLCGGYWKQPSSQIWIHPGVAVAKVLVDDTIFQRHLGWVSSETIEPGTVKEAATRTNPPVLWQATIAASHWASASPPTPESVWKIGRYAITQTGDRASTMSWVFADVDKQPVLGRVAEILSGPKNLVTLERFIYTEEPHPEFGWPTVRRPRGTEITVQKMSSFLVLEAKSIRFICSVQHDCRHGECQPSIIGKERQEREDTTRDRSLVSHRDDDHFVLNMAGIHNFMELRRALPMSLTILKPLHTDRTAFHKEISTRAQSLGMQKRKQTAERRRATAARKKEEAAKAAELAAEAEAAAKRAEEEGEMDDEDDVNYDEGHASEDEDELEDGADDEDYIVQRPRKRKRRREVGGRRNPSRDPYNDARLIWIDAQSPWIAVKMPPDLRPPVDLRNFGYSTPYKEGRIALVASLCPAAYALYETTYHSSLAIQPLTVLERSPDYDPYNTTLFLTSPLGTDVLQPGPTIYSSNGELVWSGPGLATGVCEDFNIQTFDGEQYLTMWFGVGLPVAGTGEGIALMLNSQYEIVKNVTAVNPQKTDLHEFNIAKPDNKTALVTAYHPIPVNLSSVGGPVDGWYLNAIIQEVDIATRVVLFNWTSIEHISLNESYNNLTATANTPSTAWDAVHINSIDKDSAGDYLISSRHCKTIYKIDKNGTIVWRLGGKASDFTAMGENTDLHWQHHARWRMNDTVISVFDDGAAIVGTTLFIDETVATGKYLNVDQSAMTVSLAKRLFPSIAHNVSVAEGSIEPYGDNILVGYGSNPWIEAYDAASERVVFSATIGPNNASLGISSYRVFQTSTLEFTGHPTQPPNVSLTGGDVYVSWNGATHVASYTLLTGPSAGEVETEVVSVAKTGFETKMSAAGSQAFISVAALAANGTTLGTSAVYNTSDGSVVGS